MGPVQYRSATKVRQLAYHPSRTSALQEYFDNKDSHRELHQQIRHLSRSIDSEDGAQPTIAGHPPCRQLNNGRFTYGAPQCKS